MNGFLTWLRASALAPHLRTGTHGEGIAVRYLRHKQYVVIARNVRLGKDEIDIVAFDPADHVLVFVEVKARSSASDAYRPELNLTYAKKRTILRSARKWVARHSYEGGWRIDTIFVAGSTVIDHLQEINCF